MKKNMKTLKAECPCIDCITLGICKASIKEDGLFVNLVVRCSLIEKYCGISDFVCHSEKYKTVIDIFGETHGK